jgi:hypothetical protein
MQQALERLIHLTNTIPAILRNIGEARLSEKPSPAKWSKKEIIGHLIDSATHNHHRFVRGQFEDLPEIRYDQDQWNRYSFYQTIDSEQIIAFWTSYNKQLIEIIQRIPAESLQRQVQAVEKIMTIEALIIDYVVHMEHHLKQITDY